METNKFKWTSYFIAKLSFSSLAFILAASFFVVTASAQTILYNNNGGGSESGLATGTTTRSGVAAPTAGYQWSEMQSNTGNTTETNNILGFGCIGATRIADNFTVPAGQTWTVTSIDTYAYQTNFAGATSPFTGATIRVWSGAPNAGGMIVYGDITTNRLGSSTDAMLYRIGNTTVPPPGSAPNTTRRIWRNTINTAGLTLTAGTYWIDYSFTAASGFCPPLTVVGTRGLPGWNALQFLNGTWAALVDDGNPATAPDVPQDFPFQIRGTCTGCTPVMTMRTRFDFDGDGKADYAVFRPSTGTWYIQRSQAGFFALNFGQSGDILVPEDYDGDGRWDIAVFRNGVWYIQQSTAGFAAYTFGQAGDIPQPADFTGDGRAELAVFRAGVWYTLNTVNNQFMAFNFGLSTDRPVVGDYDGDGRADYAVYRDGDWYVQQSTAGFRAFSFGAPGDRAVPADYDGDGRTDFAVYRGGVWYIQQSTAGFRAVSFGTSTDRPAPADFDGDGRADLAVYRDGIWYVQGSQSGFSAFNFGASSDLPVENVYVQP